MKLFNIVSSLLALAQMTAAADLTFNPPNLAINKLYGASKFTVMLEKKPTGGATVTFNEDSKVTFSACSFTFTEYNWNVPQEVTVYPQPGLQCSQATIIASVCAPNSAELNGKTQNYEIDAPCDSDEGECLSTGDPHIKTFAGTKYNLKPTGPYYLFKSDLLNVQADHYNCYMGQGSCANAVAIRYGTSAIVVSLIDKNLVLVKGSAQVDAAEIDYRLDGNVYTISLGDGSTILLSGTFFSIDTTIRLAKSYYGESSGLCSVCKHGMKTLVAKDVKDNATPYQHLSKFTDSWKVEVGDNMFDGNFIVPEIYKKTYETCKVVTECSPYIASTTTVPTTMAVATTTVPTTMAVTTSSVLQTYVADSSVVAASSSVDAESTSVVAGSTSVDAESTSVVPASTSSATSVDAESTAVVAESTSVVPTTPVVTGTATYETPKPVYKECPSYSGKPSTPAVKQYPNININDAKVLCESIIGNNGCRKYVDYEEHLDDCANDVASSGNKMAAEGYRQTYNVRCYDSIQEIAKNTTAPNDISNALTECGFTGKNSCPNNCGGASNGYCSKSSCQCLPGYGGNDCSTVLDKAQALESSGKVKNSAIRTGSTVSLLVFILSILYI